MIATDAAAPACAACGAPVAGRFCGGCGEARPSPDDERLLPFLRDQFHEVTSADGKLWRTVKALFVPGKLTAEFFGGRRGLYVRPVRIFLVVNVVLFFLMSGNSGTILKGPLQSHVGASVYGATAERLTRARAATLGMDRESYAAAFDLHATSLAPSLLGVLVPGLALVLWLLLLPRRASGVRHLVHATHLVTTFLAGSLLLLLVLWFGMDLLAAFTDTRFDSPDPVLLPAVIIGLCVLIGLSARRVYGLGRGYAAAVGVLAGTVGFAFAFWCFRLALFFVTFWTLDPPPA